MTINSIAKYILGNVALCRFIVIFLFAISCISCIYDIFKISLAELFPYISGEISLHNLSELPFIGATAFCTFLIFYSKEHHSYKHIIVSILLMTVSLFLRLFSSDTELINDIIIVPVAMVGVSLLLLLMFEKTENYIKDKDIHNV